MTEKNWDLKNCFHVSLAVIAAVSAAVSCLYKGNLEGAFFAGWVAALSAVVFLFLWHVHYHGIGFSGTAWYGFYYAPLADVAQSAGIISGVPLWIIVNTFLLACRLLMIPVYFLFVIFLRAFRMREGTRHILPAGAVVAAAGASVHSAAWFALREVLRNL